MQEPKEPNQRLEYNHLLNEKQLRLAKAQGDSYSAAIKETIKEWGHGEIRPSGDFTVGYAVGVAEGSYIYERGALKWYEPQAGNVHLKIFVQDANDGRFVPGLDVTVTITDKLGNGVGTEVHPFNWNPCLFHYGRNWKLSGDGVYEIRILIEPPQFMRNDKSIGNRYTVPVTVSFPRVEIQSIIKKD
jgi:hypothetical protein